MSLLEKKLSRTWADGVLTKDNRLAIAIIHDLQQKGRELASELRLRDYDSPKDFFDSHDRGECPLGALEGRADREGGLFILRSCPMTKLLESVLDDGGLPEHYKKIVDKYVEVYKSKGAILHPFCIVHQVLRAYLGDQIKVGGKHMKVYQVACRSMSSGKVLFASEGTSRVDMDETEIRKKIDGKACMYIVKF